ncbi:target of Nesh-SH3 isoform X6 [Amia ocellicauda]|uniref:target of Nesh-SH3 isoform X6 n=1 Tax=Amia ocellicauda TaxID=2972642 RepID=UPI003463F9BF
MFPRLLLFLLGGILLLSYGTTKRLQRVKRQNLKVRINATGDTIVMKFVRPNPATKLEGYILGYGSSMFSKQFIQLPENGEPYETEIDAEPKYLIAVQPIPTNEIKKQCTGQVNLEKPLHLVIGSVTPTTVLLSWGTLLKTPFEGSIMNDCLEDGHYTVRYREKERNRKWNYQTCPTSDTVIDKLKPNTPYEFGVRPTKEKDDGLWSKPVFHKTNVGGVSKKPIGKEPKLSEVKGHPNGKPRKNTLIYNPNLIKPPRIVFRENWTQPIKHHQTSSGSPSVTRTTLGQQTYTRNISKPRGDTLHTSPSVLPIRKIIPPVRPVPLNTSHGSRSPGHVLLRPTNTSQTTVTHGVNGEKHKGLLQPKHWQRTKMANNSLLEDIEPEIPDHSEWSEPTLGNSLSGHRPSNTGSGTPNSFSNGSTKPDTPVKPQQPGSIAKRPVSHNRKPNTVDDKHSNKDPIRSPIKDSVMKKQFPPVTAKPAKQERRQTTTTAAPVVNVSRFDVGDNSSIFSSHPISEVDSLGQKRFIAPHVVYKVDKKPDEPCSITNSLNYFPDEEATEQNITAPPKYPPSNLTVVTVEGCPSFVILDWEKVDNDSATEYEIISTTKGPKGEEKSIVVTNQTHSPVENLKPNSSYEFRVKALNDLGAGPVSDAVSFSTESADPRVSENLSGKDAIWTQFPFKSDSYSECNGKQYVKRTWYRKFVGVQLCNSLRYKIYLSDSLTGKYYNIGDQTGYGEDHCQFVDSFLDGRTGLVLRGDQQPLREGFYRSVRQEPVHFGQIGGNSHINYVPWYECGTTIPGKW